MATALYITSTETYSGKTAIAVGIANRMSHDGLRVGYFKPISFSANPDEKTAVDEDSRVIKRLLGLTEPLDVLCPVLITPSLLDRIVSGEKLDLIDRIMAAYNKLAADKDVVIIEGANNMATGCLIDMSGIEICAAFNAKSVVVVRYRYDLVIDHLLIAKRVVGEAVVGTVINTVPRGRMEWIEKLIKPFCEKRGIKIFGVLPVDRLLLAVSAQAIAESVDGEVLCAEEHLDNLVENVLVGAMGIESAFQYLRRKPNNVLVTGADRSDLILAALETSTTCLVLSGHVHPDAQVIGRAQEQGVPIIMSRTDTMTALERVERVFGKVRFHDPKKMLRFDEMLDERFDYAGLYAALGIKKK